MKVESTGSRLLIFINYKGISIRKFSESVDVSHGTISAMKNKGGNIGSDKLEKILDTYPELNPVWLTTGRGDMIISENPSEKGVSKNLGEDFISLPKKAFKDLRMSELTVEQKEILERIENYYDQLLQSNLEKQNKIIKLYEARDKALKAL